MRVCLCVDVGFKRRDRARGRTKERGDDLNDNLFHSRWLMIRKELMGKGAQWRDFNGSKIKKNGFQQIRRIFPNLWPRPLSRFEREKCRIDVITVSQSLWTESGTINAH